MCFQIDTVIFSVARSQIASLIRVYSNWRMSSYNTWYYAEKKKQILSHTHATHLYSDEVNGENKPARSLSPSPFSLLKDNRSTPFTKISHSCPWARLCEEKRVIPKKFPWPPNPSDKSNTIFCLFHSQSNVSPPCKRRQRTWSKGKNEVTLPRRARAWTEAGLSTRNMIIRNLGKIWILNLIFAI